METKPFIDRLSQHIISSYNLDNEELTIVFPNKRAAFHLRSDFKKRICHNIWLPQMLSIEEAFTQWSGFTLIDNLEMLFELIDIDATLRKDKGSDLSIFGSQAAQMAKDFDEIDQYAIDANHLFNYVTENKKLEIWNLEHDQATERELKYLQFFQSLLPYYTQLRARLAAQKKGYYGMISRLLAEMSEQELTQRIGQRKVVFAGFNALTTTEETIIDKLVRTAKAEIIFDYDRYYIERDNNEAGFFARHYQHSHPKWMENGIVDSLSKTEKTIHIIGTGGKTLQTKALQTNLQQSANPNATIILADEKLLIPVLNAIPDSETYRDLKVSMGYPLKETPVDAFVKAVFRLRRWEKNCRTVTENGEQRIIEGWYIWPILKTMDLEIVRVALPPSETDAFDRWKEGCVGNGKFLFSESDLDTLDFIPNIKQLLRLLLQTDSPKRSSHDILLKINELLRFFGQIIPNNLHGKEAVFLLNQLSEVGKLVNRLERMVESHGQYIADPTSAEILYRLLSSGASIKLNSSSTNGLQIMGLLETRNLDFEILHVVSLNEGILPAEKSQGSFIPHFIKKECGLPGYDEKQAVFAYHFYRLLQNSTNIYLYYNNLDTDSDSEPSRYILQIRHELSKLPNIKVAEEPFEAMAAVTPENHQIVATKSNAVEKLRLLTQEKGLSPSSLSTYLQCPLKYYFKYIEGIQDNTAEEEVGANVTGTITHDTLEFLFAPYLPIDGKQQIIGKELFDTCIKPQWEEKLAQSIAKNMPLGFPDIGFNYLKKITIRQQIKNYLEYTSEQLKAGDLAVLKTEGELSTRLKTPVGECLLKGRTDRIDRWADSIRIIDYKTGKVDNADLSIPVRQAGISDIDYLRQIPEKALQLLLYEYLYIKENPATNPSIVKANIHGLNYAKNIEFGLIHAKPNKNDNPVPFLGDDTFVADMETLLKAAIAEMLDTETPFAQTDDEKKCRNCDFRLICKR